MERGKKYQFLFQIYLSPQLDHECLKDKQHVFTEGMDLSAYRFTQDKLSVLSISHQLLLHQRKLYSIHVSCTILSLKTVYQTNIIIHFCATEVISFIRLIFVSLILGTSILFFPFNPNYNITLYIESHCASPLESYL